MYLKSKFTNILVWITLKKVLRIAKCNIVNVLSFKKQAYIMWSTRNILYKDIDLYFIPKIMMIEDVLK